MSRVRTALLILALLVTTNWLPTPTFAQEPCRFVMGFGRLRELVGAQKVGSCLEDEHFNLENGNAEQRTSGGLFVWRKADNFTAFTDGGTTWVNGPTGVQSRSNAERFPWEKDPVAASAPQPANAAATTPASTPPPSPSPTPRPQAATSEGSPSLEALFPTPAEMPSGYVLTKTQKRDDDQFSVSEQRTYEIAGENAGIFVTIWIASSPGAVTSIFTGEQETLRSLGYTISPCEQCMLADEAVLATKVTADSLIAGTSILGRSKSVVYRVISLDQSEVRSRAVAERLVGVEQVVTRKINAAYGSTVVAAPQARPGAGAAPAERTATYEGLTVTVLQVERPWRRPGRASGPEPGMEYVTVEVRFENATQSQVRYSGANFKVTTADGARWNWSNERDPAIVGGQALPGTPVRGWITFKVPVGSQVIQLLWEPTSRQTFPIPL